MGLGFLGGHGAGRGGAGEQGEELGFHVLGQVHDLLDDLAGEVLEFLGEHDLGELGLGGDGGGVGLGQVGPGAGQGGLVVGAVAALVGHPVPVGEELPGVLLEPVLAGGDGVHGVEHPGDGLLGHGEHVVEPFPGVGDGVGGAFEGLELVLAAEYLQGFVQVPGHLAQLFEDVLLVGGAGGHGGRGNGGGEVHNHNA